MLQLLPNRPAVIGVTTPAPHLDTSNVSQFYLSKKDHEDLNKGELTLDWNPSFDNYYYVTISRVQFGLDGLTSHDCIPLFILVDLHPSHHHGTVHHHYHYPVCLLSGPSDRQSLCVKVHLRNNKNLFAVFTNILHNKWSPMNFWRKNELVFITFSKCKTTFWRLLKSTPTKIN